MEKKGRGESNSFFSRRNWTRRWFVLSGTELTYYDSYDQKTNKIGTLKGNVNVKGSTFTITQHKDKKFTFVIEHPDKKPFTLSSDSEEHLKSKT